jgi:hypothetical protein
MTPDETRLEDMTPEQAERVFGPRIAGFMRDVILSAQRHGLSTAVIIHETAGTIGGFSVGADHARMRAGQRVTAEAQQMLALLLTPGGAPGRGN